MKISEKLIPHSYSKEFVNCLENIERKYGWEFFNLTGIGDQLDANSFGKNFFNTEVTADSSVDPNSNVSDKSVIAYHFEAHKPQETINALYRLWKGLVKLKKDEYKKEHNDSDFVGYKAVNYANNVIEKQVSGEIYINDITGMSTNRSYCYNYCTLDITTSGIPKDFDGEGVNPPKHLTTYFSQLLDFMIYAGNSTLGAVGIADALITATCYFKRVLEQCGDDNVNFSSEEDCWKHLESKFEKFLYDINKPNRANQSLFSNISLYDDNFLKDLCPSYVVEIEDKLYSADIETVKKVQDVFIKVYNKEQKRRLMTFPVLTPCISLDGDRNLLHKEFLEKCIEQNQDFKMMNLYGGETSTLSSCCFDKNQDIVYIKTREDISSGIYNVSSFKDVYAEGKNNTIFVSTRGGFAKAKVVKLPIENKKMYYVNLDICGKQDTIVCTEDHIFPTSRGDVITEDLEEGDTLSVYHTCHDKNELRNTPNDFATVVGKEIIQDYDEAFVYCVEMQDKSDPYFTLPNGVLVGNCRLRSKKDAKYMNTLGSGSVKIGSIGVVTGNLPRIARNSKNVDELKEKLEEIVEIGQSINYVKRKNIKKAIKQGRIPLYSHGFININTQYNTIGVIGFNEMCNNMGIDITSNEGQDLVLEVMHTLNTKNEEMSDKYEVPTNVEQIPGENVAIKLAKKDSLLGYNKEYDMYSNQFIPLTSKANIFDRIDLQSKFDKHFGGGSILHINIDEMEADVKTQVELVETMFKKGVIYFAFNNIIGVCNECGANTVQNKSDVTEDNTGKCKKCGSTDVDIAFRVVGFVRKVKNWAKQRREEFKNRKFYNL